MKLLAAAVTAFALAASAPAMAATYNATTEFNGVQGGTSGAWTYGLISGDTFSELTALGGGAYFGRPGANFDTPLIGYADGNGDLLMHPGEFGELIVLRFTALTAGNYNAQFTARLTDNSCPQCTSTDGVLASLNGVSAVINRPEGYAPVTLNFSGFRNAGETIDFALAPRANYGWDSTRASAIVSTSGAVPEPASWALMLAGFAGTGTLLRASRRRLVPVRATA